jgi:DNA-3-methyladenine glycosylase I
MIKHPYCKYVSNIKDKNDVDKIYHDNHYGRDIKNDNELFCRFIMEIHQAGLSWRTILNKEKGLRKAFHNFDINKIAKYKDKDFKRLMNDSSIIRNRLKIHSTIHNAKQIVKIQSDYKSFRNWLRTHEKLLKQDKGKWVKLFKNHFKFVGGEIVGEFLMSIGILEGSHDKKCKFFVKSKQN